jgi:hypothetical protein
LFTESVGSSVMMKYEALNRSRGLKMRVKEGTVEVHVNFGVLWIDI